MATLGRETHIGEEVKIKKGSTLYNKIYEYLGFVPIFINRGLYNKSYTIEKDVQNSNNSKYVFEYDYIANASGKFSNGITTLQNYYAPQMNAHTQGANVVISD